MNFGKFPIFHLFKTEICNLWKSIHFTGQLTICEVAMNVLVYLRMSELVFGGRCETMHTFLK